MFDSIINYNQGRVFTSVITLEVALGQMFVPVQMGGPDSIVLPLYVDIDRLQAKLLDVLMGAFVKTKMTVIVYKHYQYSGKVMRMWNGD